MRSELLLRPDGCLRPKASKELVAGKATDFLYRHFFRTQLSTQNPKAQACAFILPEAPLKREPVSVRCTSALFTSQLRPEPIQRSIPNSGRQILAKSRSDARVHVEGKISAHFPFGAIAQKSEATAIEKFRLQLLVLDVVPRACN